MKKNKIVIETENTKKEYKILMKVETNDNEYVIYTDESCDETGEIIAYTGSYKIVNDCQVIRPVNDTETLEFLDTILVQIQNIMNKNEESELNE